MKKLKHGLDIYTLLIDIIMSLTPNQAESLYSELLPRYTRRAKIKYYNIDGEEDPNGKIRLVPYQYKAIRTTFGDTYIKKSFRELTSYIEYLQKHIDDTDYKRKLAKYTTGSHNKLLTDKNSWVYNKCKYTITADRPRLNLNPYLIDDLATAREYIKTIPKELRNTSFDVESLLLRFPELNCEDDE